MKLSPSQFRRVFKRFQAIHLSQCNCRLESFSDPNSFVVREEGYKNAIPSQAKAILNPERWSRTRIGSGMILDRVIKAIELPGNNLLQWEAREGPNSRAHRRLIEAQSNPQMRAELEKLLYNLYRKRRSEQSVFDGLVELCGKRYELLAYLFFIAAPETFLPIRTKTFDRAMRELGVDLRTAHNCSWSNYQEFLAVMREVRCRLHAEGLPAATLLDAHSFCWLFVHFESTTIERNPRPQKIKLEPFTGVLQKAAIESQFLPIDMAIIRDMKMEAEKREASGEIAEETALIAERDRLHRAGRPDLARKVETVSNRPGLGYDIKSIEVDGRDRFIEVKNVEKATRFFISHSEWLNSRKRSNYWFYLVKGARVSCLRATRLKPTHLKPMEYFVSYSPSASRSAAE